MDKGIYELVGDTLYISGINKTNTTVYGKHIDLNIALDNIHSVKIEKLDGWRTTGCVMGVTTAVAMFIVLAIGFSSIDNSPKKCEYEGCNFEEKKD